MDYDGLVRGDHVKCSTTQPAMPKHSRQQTKHIKPRQPTSGAQHTPRPQPPQQPRHSMRPRHQKPLQKPPQIPPPPDARPLIAAAGAPRALSARSRAPSVLLPAQHARSLPLSARARPRLRAHDERHAHDTDTAHQDIMVGSMQDVYKPTMPW